MQRDGEHDPFADGVRCKPVVPGLVTLSAPGSEFVDTEASAKPMRKLHVSVVVCPHLYVYTSVCMCGCTKVYVGMYTWTRVFACV